MGKNLSFDKLAGQRAEPKNMFTILFPSSTDLFKAERGDYLDPELASQLPLFSANSINDQAMTLNGFEYVPLNKPTRCSKDEVLRHRSPNRPRELTNECIDPLPEGIHFNCWA